MTESTFTWLDYDAEQARRSAEMLKALRETETVDSIGIGAIRDGFAGVLFPGTSTIQTRVRYFLLVPWSMQSVAARRPRDRAQYARFLNDIEARTIASLIKGSDKNTTGIIGRNRGERTLRMPSSVYWTALAQWGIRTAADLSLSGYREQVLARRTKELLDGEEGDGSVYQVFDEMPSMPESFPDLPMDILPTPDEADYLLARMQGTVAGGVWNPRPAGLAEPSLLALVAHEPELAEVGAPWDLPGDMLTPLLSEALGHAEPFSLVIQGARLRYVQLLFDAQRREGLSVSGGEEKLAGLVEGWVEDMANSSGPVGRWLPNLAEMFEFLRRQGTPVGSLTRGFVRQWCEMAVGSPAAAMSDTRSASLVTAREAVLKGSHARLSNASPLRSWEGSLFGSSPLDYRWGIVQRLVLDCRDGLEATGAGT